MDDARESAVALDEHINIASLLQAVDYFSYCDGWLLILVGSLLKKKCFYRFSASIGFC